MRQDGAFPRLYTIYSPCAAWQSQAMLSVHPIFTSHRAYWGCWGQPMGRPGWDVV